MPAKQSKPITVMIDGEGTQPVTTNGARRRLPKGEPVEISAAEKAVLDRNNIRYAKSKAKR